MYGERRPLRRQSQSAGRRYRRMERQDCPSQKTNRNRCRTMRRNLKSRGGRGRYASRFDSMGYAITAAFSSLRGLSGTG
ncbi:hypothetical protein KCP74_11465 [Salmonella enterica subsp. enterica]|nr:hypothetical protein KCP74_11465 [Salmonella enterica subsp. enterica]